MKNIATALVKARKAFGPAIKSSKNPHFKSSYADLGTCLDAVSDALTEAGVFLYQETFEGEGGVTVETVFLHESGEMLRCGRLHVPASKQDAQGYGSAMTYARRYSLMAACGIAAEDDDGNAAAKKPAEKLDDAAIEKHLATLRDAALEGMEALQAAFAALPANPEKKAVWARHGDSLKQAAMAAMKGGK